MNRILILGLVLLGLTVPVFADNVGEQYRDFGMEQITGDPAGANFTGTLKQGGILVGIGENISTGISAYATGGQSNATQLASSIVFHQVSTCATNGDSVKLRDAAADITCAIRNDGVAVLSIYPYTGEEINSLGANTAISLNPGATMRFHADTATHWYAELNGGGTPETLTTGITAFATGGQASATALTSVFNNVTVCATAGDSVKLPTATAGAKVTVKNNGAATLAVFPATSDSINALAVNLSVDVAVNSEVTFRSISGVVWETQEVLTIPSPTTQTGNLVIQAAASAGNTNTTITNASQAAARTYTIPDAGASASFAMTEGAQTINGVQTFTLPQVTDTNTTITAFATGGQASATALAGQFNNVTTCATAGDSVKLPTAVAGLVIAVKNSGAATLAVFPFSGDSINALAVNLSVDVAVNSVVTFRAIDATVWESDTEVLTIPSPTTQTGNLVIQAAANAGNTNTIITNISQAAARTYTIPDAGASGRFLVHAGIVGDGLVELITEEATVTLAGALETATGLTFPAGSIPFVAQGNIESLVVATTATKIGLDVTAGGSAFGLTSALTKNTKLKPDVIAGGFGGNVGANALAGVSKPLFLIACDNAGSAAGTLNSGTVRVRISYWKVSDLVNAP